MSVNGGWAWLLMLGLFFAGFFMAKAIYHNPPDPVSSERFTTKGIKSSLHCDGGTLEHVGSGTIRITPEGVTCEGCSPEAERRVREYAKHCKTK